MGRATHNGVGNAVRVRNRRNPLRIVEVGTVTEEIAVPETTVFEEGETQVFLQKIITSPDVKRTCGDVVYRLTWLTRELGEAGGRPQAGSVMTAAQLHAIFREAQQKGWL
jgi:hypothetical protein